MLGSNVYYQPNVGTWQFNWNPTQYVDTMIFLPKVGWQEKWAMYSILLSFASQKKISQKLFQNLQLHKVCKQCIVPLHLHIVSRHAHHGNGGLKDPSQMDN